MSEQKELQSKTKMALICFFVGGLGIHRMMMGYDNWWYMLLANLVCLGGVWTLYDFIMILTGKMTMADGRALS